MMNFDYDLLDAFDAVISSGGFHPAARALHITQPAVSQRIKLLEEQVGQPVLVRGNPPQPTSYGALLLRHIRQVKALESEVAEERGADVESDFLTASIAVNTDTLYYWLIDALLPVLRKKKIVLELLVDDEERTDQFLRSGQVYGAVSINSRPPNGCKSTPLGSLNFRCVATKAFRKKYFSEGLNRESLSQAPYVDFDIHDPLHRQYLWKYFRLKGEGIPRFLVPSSKGLLQLTLNGVVYSLLPEIEALPLLQRGRLVELTPGKVMNRKYFWHSWYVQPPLFQEISNAISSFSRKVLQ